MRKLIYSLLCPMLLVSIAACSKGGNHGSSATASVITAWKDAKLTPTDFAAVAGGELGGSCRAGHVDGLETLLCEYPDAKAAKAAEAAGLARVGETTGTAIAKDKLLLVVADRKKVDPEGRRLNLIAKTFRGR